MPLSRDAALGFSAGALLAMGLPSIAGGFNAWLNHDSATRIASYAFGALSVPVAAFALTFRPYAVRITSFVLILFFLAEASPLLTASSNSITARRVISSFAGACVYMLCLISLYLTRRLKTSPTDNDEMKGDK